MLRKIQNLEKLLLITGLIIVISVFIISFSAYIGPQNQVWESRIFDTWNESGYTYIKGYGIRSLNLLGYHDIKIGKFYQITFMKTLNGNVVKEIKIIE